MKHVLLLLTSLILAACGSAPEPPAAYLMRSGAMPESREFQRGTVPVALGRIEVASYLDQPGIVTARPDGSIHVSNHSEWAEPLRKSLRSFLAAELSAALKEDVSADASGLEDALRIDVGVDQLHGGADGYAILVAFWSYELDGDRAEFQYTSRKPLEAEGYAALVAAEEELLSGLAAEIAGELRSRR